MKTRKVLLSLLLVGLFMFTSLGAGYAQDASGAQPVSSSTEVVSPYLTLQHVTYADGTVLEGALINGPSEPPAEFEAERQASIMALPREGTLPNFPSFSWVFGCSAVSASMIATYYDRGSYPNMYTGPTAGGVMPLTDTSWPTWSDGYKTYPNNPLIASHKGVDGRGATVKGSIDDYWIKYGSSAADPYITGSWTQHAWSTSVGDFMKTSQSKYSSTDGSTWFWTNGATKLLCSDMPKYDSGFGWGKISDFDGTYGRKLFYEARGYTVTDCYAQGTDNKYAGGFSLANFQAQIDAGHPVFLNLAGHSIVGYGYSGSTIYVRDTWDNNTAHTYTMPWGGSYSGMELRSVSIVRLAASGPVVIPTPVAPAGTITDTTPTFQWTKITNATKYEFRLYKGTSTTPLWTKPALAADCGTTHCTKTPTTALALASYKWQVRAYVGGAWKAWSANKAFTVAAPVVIPTPVAPAGTITDTTPTFKWTKITNATKYEFRLYKGTSTTPLWTKPALAADCGTTYCTKTPTTALALASYKWQVRAYVSGAWKAWSANKAFTLAAPSTGFNSQFNGNMTGWAKKGTVAWKVNTTSMYSAGVANNWSQAYWTGGQFSNFTYSARLKRGASSNSANTLFVRMGTTVGAGSLANMWTPGYYFEYTNNGYYSVWQINSPSINTPLKTWTTTTAIKKNDWNTLKVVANGSSLKYYINGTLVYSGTNTYRSSGYVGVGFADNGDAGDTLYVDWATLSKMSAKYENNDVVSAEQQALNDAAELAAPLGDVSGIFE